VGRDYIALDGMLEITMNYGMIQHVQKGPLLYPGPKIMKFDTNSFLDFVESKTHNASQAMILSTFRLRCQLMICCHVATKSGRFYIRMF
jgi:hypothetical protein